MERKGEAEMNCSKSSKKKKERDCNSCIDFSNGSSAVASNDDCAIVCTFER